MIKDLELGIKSKDDIPVQKNYLSILRPIYPEIKHYLEDLLNKKFVTRSNSSCSSSVVCVRKKDGSSRLCVDYRSLNAKPVADRHLIPLDNLGGNAWFSVLDKGKAYYQGFMSTRSQNLTGKHPRRDCKDHVTICSGYWCGKKSMYYNYCQLSQCIERRTVKEQCRECIYKERD